MKPRFIAAVLITLTAFSVRRASAAEPAYTRTEDVVYGRKYGTALTLDVFTPRPANGAAVVMVMSGGWFSAHEMINPGVFKVFLDRGYTVFTVVHGSQPKFTIPEIMDDMHRAIRFIRHHAKDYAIQPDRLGISGGSAGGHLSLMIGTAGRKGDPKAKDPVDRESSRVQAVGCFFPPTDFLNYGRPGRTVFEALDEELSRFRAPFDFVELDPETHQFRLIREKDRRLQIARDISPVTHVTPDDPPILIIHGDADKLVPLQQAQVIVKVLKQNGVPARLVVKAGGGHGWQDWIADESLIADWLDRHLLEIKAASSPE